MNRIGLTPHSTYYHLIGHGPDFDRLIAFLSGRLPPDQKQRFYDLIKEDLQIDMEQLFQHATSMLKMFKNSTVVYGDGKKNQGHEESISVRVSKYIKSILTRLIDKLRGQR